MKGIRVEETPHTYLGPDCNLAPFGPTKKGDVIWLNPEKTAYVKDDKHFKRFKKAEEEKMMAERAKIAQAALERDEKVMLERAALEEEPSEADTEAEIEQFKKDLAQNFPKKDDLIQYCVDNGVELEGKPNKDEIVEAIVAKIFA